MENIFGESGRFERELKCPMCHYILDSFSATLTSENQSTDAPNPGSFSVCLNCATVLVFEIGERFRVATRDDLKELSESEPDSFAMLGKIEAAAQRLREARRKKCRRI